ncbi:hypothetical protein KIW84_061437 [Lathyrus oleraceus]|uniref:Uncharacterized protein n=1 Tax=Pisum sativum TaxID=3888 RepID=A0A9D5A6V0_PEA|nr:hypothetical protein KIW84_061437 [Pisum sativum]
MYVFVATSLLEGVSVCLRKLIMASLYEVLGQVSKDLRRGVDNFQTGAPIWLLPLWLNATFAHALDIQIPLSTEVGAKGIRLIRLTPEDGKGVFKAAFEKTLKIDETLITPKWCLLGTYQNEFLGLSHSSRVKIRQPKVKEKPVASSSDGPSKHRGVRQTPLEDSTRQGALVPGFPKSFPKKSKVSTPAVTITRALCQDTIVSEPSANKRSKKMLRLESSISLGTKYAGETMVLKKKEKSHSVSAQPSTHNPSSFIPISPTSQVLETITEELATLGDGNALACSVHGAGLQPTVSMSSLSEEPKETPVELFKCLIESCDELDMGSPSFLKASSVSDFDELFQQLKLKVASINLLEVSRANLPILDELQELMFKLSGLEAPFSISTAVLDLEILLDQAIQIVASKRDVARCVEEKVAALTQQ